MTDSPNLKTAPAPAEGYNDLKFYFQQSEHHVLDPQHAGH